MPEPEATTAPKPLQMVQMRFDARSLMRSAHKQKLPVHSEDLGYLLHGQLAALFGEFAPKPFFARHHAGTRDLRADVEVLGYCQADEATLQDHAGAFAEPADLEALRDLAVKTLPASWAAGRRLGFEVRACPVVRTLRDTPNRRAGKEVDAFLAACDIAGPDAKLSRAEVYREWLERRFGTAAALEAFDLHRFRRVRLFRRRQGGERSSREIERPDVIFRGELTVLDNDAFTRLLTRGIGRHRAFGFGMLLLRPPRAGGA